MTRRGFFSVLCGAAALAIDPDRLLWSPGKLISIPIRTSLPVRYPLVSRYLLDGVVYPLNMTAMEMNATVEDDLVIFGEYARRIAQASHLAQEKFMREVIFNAH